MSRYFFHFDCGEANGEAKRFRYNVAPRSKVCVLTPKQLDEGLDRMSVRATMIGAAFHGQYNKLPKTDLARVCWEVGCFFLHPRQVSPWCLFSFATGGNGAISPSRNSSKEGKDVASEACHTESQDGASFETVMPCPF